MKYMIYNVFVFRNIAFIIYGFIKFNCIYKHSLKTNYYQNY